MFAFLTFFCSVDDIFGTSDDLKWTNISKTDQNSPGNTDFVSEIHFFENRTIQSVVKGSLDSEYYKKIGLNMIKRFHIEIVNRFL